MITDLEEALNVVIAETGHEKYRWLVSDANPDVAKREHYRKRIIERANPKPPSLVTTIANAAGAANRVIHAAIHGQALVVDNEEQDRRLAICHGCPKYIADQDKCSVCGCVGRWKTRLRTEHCPLPEPKW
jgi:hypothetical protein